MTSIHEMVYGGTELFYEVRPRVEGSGRDGDGSSSLGSRGEPAPPERQREFADLFARAGVHRGRGAAELLRCPWHQDDTASLSINWTAAVFKCHASSCGEKGGIRRLRELVGVSRPVEIRGDTPRAWAAPPRPLQNERPRPEPDALRERLADGVEHLLGWEHGNALRSCRTRFSIYRCPDGHRPGFPISCGNQLCPRCGPRKLAADWRAKLKLPDGLRLIELRTLSHWGEGSPLEAIRRRFAKWRHARILNGVYGVRLERSGAGLAPAILLILPPGESLPDGGRAFDVRQVAGDATAQEALTWLQDHYVDESSCWQSHEELGLLLAESKKRRRFQCWGLEFQKGGSYVQGDADDGIDVQGGSDTLQSTGRNPPPSGGAGHAKGHHKDVICPVCGAVCDPKPMFTVGREEVEELAGGKGYVWKRR